MPTQPTTNTPQLLGIGPVNAPKIYSFLSGNPVYVSSPPTASTGKGPLYINPNAGVPI